MMTRTTWAAILVAWRGTYAWGEVPPPATASPMPLGINLAAANDWTTEYPFVDVFRLARPWISQKEGAGWGQGPTLDLDERGWIRRLESGCSADTLLCSHGNAPSGRYVCLYDGEGELEFRDNVTTLLSEPGRIEFEGDGRKGRFILRLKRTDVGNPVRNIRVIMPGFEATYREDPFHPTFLATWKPFRVFRFMHWMHINRPDPDMTPLSLGWDRRPCPEDATYAGHGVPVEVMVELCNRLKIHPWFCLPHRADDGYVRQFARLVKDRLDPALKVYVEYSNEVWNSQFSQSKFVQAQAKALGLGPAERPWEGGALYYGRRSVEIFRLWEAEFGGTERLVRVLAWQAASGSYWTDGLLLGVGDTVRHVDALAIAPYMTLCIPVAEADAIAALSVDAVLDRVEQRVLPQCAAWMATHKRVADQYGVSLIAYEAGQHLVGVGVANQNDALTAKFNAANRDPRMGAIYTRYLDAWAAAGGGLMCVFETASTYSRWGSWGLLEYSGQSPAEAPKFRAVMEWLQPRRAP